MRIDMTGTVTSVRQPPEWAAAAIVAAGQRMDARGWVPATAGNISVRLPDDTIAITSSGNHKGFLKNSDIMVVDQAGKPLTPVLKPSAETLLHCQIYRLDNQAGAVVHGHSVAATVLSMAPGKNDAPPDFIRLEGYEVLKAFGVKTHQITLDLPILDNDQDMERLASIAEPILLRGAPLGYLIRGHGVYIWGGDMAAALARLEGLEFLLACELERRRLR
ncbi:Methylthioribulose 1-phosphate dehydratase [Granulibacter bethesdensis]|nr:Methylthioribulose 1-phosphate dehydratase [Granulibacter bethesdensis]